jgi:hypothetical protein
MAAFSTMFEPGLLKRVENFAFRDPRRRLGGDLPEPMLPACAAHRRFPRRWSVHSGR